MLVTLEGQEYSTIGKLNVFDQLHVTRKLGSALPIVESLISAQNVSKDKTLLIVLALAQVSDTDSEYVVKKCLSVVMRKQNNTFAKITTVEGHLMFDDIPLSTLLELTVNVIEENLGNFLRTALDTLGAQAKQNN